MYGTQVDTRNLAMGITTDASPIAPMARRSPTESMPAATIVRQIAPQNEAARISVLPTVVLSGVSEAHEAWYGLFVFKFLHHVDA